MTSYNFYLSGGQEKETASKKYVYIKERESTRNIFKKEKDFVIREDISEVTFEERYERRETISHMYMKGRRI